MTVTKLREEASEEYDLEHSGDFLQIYHGDGNWIFRAPFLEKNLSPLEAPPHKQRKFENIQLAGKPFRFVTQGIEVNGRLYLVETTKVSTDQISSTLSLFRRYLVMLAPGLLLAAAFGGYWLSRKALSPVDVLTRTARSIGGHNLGERSDPRS